MEPSVQEPQGLGSLSSSVGCEGANPTVSDVEHVSPDSAATPAQLSADPENILLARGPRFRLPAEFVRDQALKVAGLLVPKIGGPSVRSISRKAYGKTFRSKETSRPNIACRITAKTCTVAGSTPSGAPFRRRGCRPSMPRSASSALFADPPPIRRCRRSPDERSNLCGSFAQVR